MWCSGMMMLCRMCSVCRAKRREYHRLSDWDSCLNHHWLCDVMRSRKERASSKRGSVQTLFSRNCYLQETSGVDRMSLITNQKKGDQKGRERESERSKSGKPRREGTHPRGKVMQSYGVNMTTIDSRSNLLADRVADRTYRDVNNKELCQECA